MSYITKADLASWMETDQADVMALIITAASDSVDRYCGQSFDPAPAGVQLAVLVQSARWYDRRGNPSGPLTERSVDDVGWKWGSTAVADLDSDVKAMLEPHRKRWYFA